MIVGLALAIRFTPMHRGLGFDELFTAVNFVGAESAWKTATTSINFNNHVGYSLLARLCVELFGRSEWALRLPALLLGLGTLPALWWVSRPVVGPWIAVAATLGLALAPEHIRWSTTARGYTALILGVILTSALLFQLLRRPTARTAAAFAALTTATGYCHLYAAPVAVVQGLALVGWFAAHRHDASSRRSAIYGVAALAAAGLLTLLLYSPILRPLLFSVNHAGRGQLMPDFAWYTAIELLSVSSAWLLCAVLALAAIGIVAIARTGRTMAPWHAGYAAAIVLAPLIGAILARPLDLYPRFFIYALPVMLVVAGVGATALVRQLARFLPSSLQLAAWAPILGLVFLVGASWYTMYPAAMTDEGFREAVRALQADHAAADPDEKQAYCAFGAGAELFQWYSAEPLIIPKTVDELRRAYRGRGAPACVYRPASWESRGATEIRAYLEERSTTTRHSDILVFRSR